MKLQLVNTFERVNRVPIHIKLFQKIRETLETCYANADKAYKELN